MKIFWGNGYTRAAVLGLVMVLILTLGDDGLSADSVCPIPLRLADSVIVNFKIKTPQDLKGKRVGITRFGSTSDALLPVAFFCLYLFRISTEDRLP